MSPSLAISIRSPGPNVKLLNVFGAATGVLASQIEIKHVLELVRRELFGRDCTGVEQGVGKGVVLGELFALEFAVAEAIGIAGSRRSPPRSAVEPVQGQHHGRSHVGIFVDRPGAAEYFLIDVGNGVADCILDPTGLFLVRGNRRAIALGMSSTAIRLACSPACWPSMPPATMNRLEGWSVAAGIRYCSRTRRHVAPTAVRGRRNCLHCAHGNFLAPRPRPLSSLRWPGSSANEGGVANFSVAWVVVIGVPLAKEALQPVRGSREYQLTWGSTLMQENSLTAQ